MAHLKREKINGKMKVIQVENEKEEKFLLDGTYQRSVKILPGCTAQIFDLIISSNKDGDQIVSLSKVEMTLDDKILKDMEFST